MDRHYLSTIKMYVISGVLCGVICGGSCIAFAWATTLCDNTFQANHWLLFLLPVSGIAVVLLYDFFRSGEDLATDAIFKFSHKGNSNGYDESDSVSPWLAPLIFISTCLAYLTGGSCGRVGSALQIGGCLSAVICRRFSGAAGLRSVYIACGMAAGFTAILNAPVAGAVFGVELLILSGWDLMIVFPALLSSFITWGISKLAHVPYTDFHNGFSGGITDAGSTSDDAAMAAVLHTGLDASIIWRVVVIAAFATIAGRLFCYGRLAFNAGFELMGNKIVRVLVGTGLVIGITLLIGTYDFNGLGFGYVDKVLDGNSAMFAFAFKLVLTCLTLGCGIRGGEISPVIFIGATSCFALGCLIGLDPTLAAALGIVGTLGSVTNTPIAIMIYGLEAIECSGEMVIYFAITALIAHLCSGTYGLYHQQHAENQILKPRIP